MRPPRQTTNSRFLALLSLSHNSRPALLFYLLWLLTHRVPTLSAFLHFTPARSIHASPVSSRAGATTSLLLVAWVQHSKKEVGCAAQITDICRYSCIRAICSSGCMHSMQVVISEIYEPMRQFQKQKHPVVSNGARLSCGIKEIQVPCKAMLKPGTRPTRTCRVSEGPRYRRIQTSCVM